MNFTIEQIEEQVLISQINDSHTRRVLIPTITAFNKAAKAAGTQQMNVEYLLRKRLPGFAAFLESCGINIAEDVNNNLRVFLGGLEVHLDNNPNIDRQKLLGGTIYTWHSIALSYLFKSYYLKVGMEFKVFNLKYVAIPNNNYPYPIIVYEGFSKGAPLDLLKYFILLEEV